ncbi:hydroxyethylthiazole kinase [Aliarcobacter trophiarum LMG 25534]|uniref:Hydroxyethylthiazole kinase n=1 Tax=Aliarcobacter trophiarum LMG 25534 TaxID=1032241 RepID=A0AAD0VL87_9BACT|nr:hydroxyethylthiazole kinase [Aliarcobacter trophiarum]AXK47987.1 hydroxyethylthiazole kinase [Aliarcobacter trophiarum LMG 25534]RXJ90065.1 hydroxyethylthiazole kinase [Aliarcobacter trophiarum LMG 25534]
MQKDLKDRLADILEFTREKNPLCFQITNYVTVNDCANVTLAIGASPAMADEKKEVESLVNIASSLYLNIGTINKRVKKSILKATKKANKLDIPVILDPVGIGVSKFRKDLVDNLLKNYKIAVVRGNISEIKAILNVSSKSKGADASFEDLENIENSIKLANKLAKKYKTVVAITGKVDVISNGKEVATIENESDDLPKITGTGCMCTSLVASFCGAKKDMIFEATVLGVLTMALNGELATISSKSSGLGTFYKELFNKISKFDRAILLSKAKINLV